MAHENAKSILKKANTDAERTDAIRTAIQLGMPLTEIQDYLDWLDQMRGINSNEDHSADLDDNSSS